MDSLATIGKPAPDFSLHDLHGKAHRLSDQRGTITVLNFWSANCPWAEVGDKILAEMELLGQESVQLWPIAGNVDESPELVRAMASERGLPFVLHDEDQRVINLYGAMTTPHVFVVDGAGVLRYKGAIDNTTFRQRTATKTYLHDALQALLEGRSLQEAETPAYGCAIVRHRAA